MSPASQTNRSASGSPSRSGGPSPKPARDAEDLFTKKQLVLVTGGTGFLGSHLVEALVRRGYRVRLLIRRSSSLRWLEGVPVEYAYGDVRDKASLAGACIGVRSVFHFGGLTRARMPGDFHQANGLGTRNLAEALAERGTPGGFFVYCSSLAAGGPGVALERDPTPIRTESDPATPISPYGRSKLAGEVALREVADAHGSFRHVILRPSAVFGPRDEGTLTLFRMIKHGLLPAPALPESRLSLIYAEDLIEASILAAEKSVRGTYYLSDGETYTWAGVGRSIAEQMDVNVRELRISKPLAMACAGLAESWGFLIRRPSMLSRAKVREMWQPHWVCSCEKARRDWGFAPRNTLMRGLEETLTWYRLNQWL